MEIAVLGLGCFWGPEIKFSKLDGIIKTEVGYCGGNSKEASYKEVCTGNTNHAEVVKLDFDPKIISYEEILKFLYSKFICLSSLVNTATTCHTNNKQRTFFADFLNFDPFLNQNFSSYLTMRVQTLT